MNIGRVPYFPGVLPQGGSRAFDLSRSDQQASRMSRLRQAFPGALATVAFLLLSGCGQATPTSPTTPAATPATTAPGATLTPTTPTPTPSPTVKPSKVACPAVGPIPDGSWTGPLTMHVTSSPGKGFVTSRGTGSLRIVVARGRVTGGRWSLHWLSRGHVDTGQAAASIVLPTTLTGTTRGSAAKPLLSATWRIHGTATITKPVHQSIPFNETGQVSNALRITSLSCNQVTGSVPLSFASKDAQESFSGTARWFARRS